MKKLIAVLILVCMAVSVSACGSASEFTQDVIDSAVNKEVKSKTFEFDGGSIELNTGFYTMNFVSEDYDFILGDGTLTVMGKKQVYVNAEISKLTASEYASAQQENLASFSPTELTEVDGIPTFLCFSENEGGELVMSNWYFKTSEGFWCVIFAANKSVFDGLYEDICGYAKSIKFS